MGTRLNVLRRIPPRPWGWRRLGVVATGILLASTGMLPKWAHGSPVSLAGGKGTPPAGAASQMGSWSEPVNLTVSAIHAALLTNGSVLFWQSDSPFNSGTPSRANLWNPATNAVQSNNLTYNYDIFCSGHSELPNGQLLIAGGRDDTRYHQNAGIPQAFLYDPASNAWAQAPDMSYARWYPSNIELADGTTLIASGTDDNSELVLEMEEYNSQTNSFTVLPRSANMLKTGTWIYPRMVLLPSGDVFMGGMFATSLIFNPATNAWAAGAKMKFGERIYGAMVPLPGLQKVLAVGGNHEKSQTGNATPTAETIDFSQPSPAWTYVASMNEARQNMNLVLLPDGTVLAVGGGGGGGRYNNPVYSAEDYNPATNTWTLFNSQQAQRTYHSTALLLPDGRVVSAGSDSGPMAKTLEVFSPPYLFKGLRPTITSAPSALTYGQQFTIKTPNAAGIARVALIKVASTTHATRFDERFVDLSFTTGKGQITATAPPSGNYAPPGYYMLDILSKTGVPAVMPFVQLTSQ